MLHAISERALPQRGDLVNLEDLRYQLTGRLALLLIGASSLAMVVFLLQEPFSLVAFGLLATLFGLGWIIQTQVKAHPKLARHLLTWGLTASLVAAMGLFNNLWLPFLGLSLIFVGAILVSGGEMAAAGIIGLAAAWLNYRQTHAYPLPELAAALALGMAATWLATHIFYTALEWAWAMQRRADHLLETTRQHQAELSRIVKSLDLTNALLQRTQNELIVARRKADEARHLKEQFAANISHELRTPLASIRLLVDTLQAGALSNPAVAPDMLAKINAEVDVLSQLARELLDLALIESGQMPLKLAPTDLHDLAQVQAERFSPQTRQKGLTLAMDIAPGTLALADGEMIGRVLANLLHNACKFTPSGGRVSLTARHEGDNVIVSVADTGPGIPPDELSRVFERFYKVDRARGQAGTGLGLAVARHIVEGHGGLIWAESAPGHGATFRFSLPAG
jgi:signal transduction histidine kinase